MFFGRYFSFSLRLWDLHFYRLIVWGYMQFNITFPRDLRAMLICIGSQSSTMAMP